MDTRVIDGTLFFVSRAGWVEHVQASAEVIQQAQDEISQAEARIRGLEIDAGEIRSHMEAAALAGDLTTSHRAKLTDLAQATNRYKSAIADADAKINEVRRTLARREAEQIEQVHRKTISDALKQLNPVDFAHQFSQLQEQAA